MEVALITLDTGHISMEFDTGMLPTVLQICEDLFGHVRIHSRSSYEVITIGKCAFVSETEFDETCLISDSRECDLILKRIAEIINGRTFSSNGHQ